MFVNDELDVQVAFELACGIPYLVRSESANYHYVFETKGAKVVQLMCEDSALPYRDQALRIRASLRKKSTASTGNENDSLG